MEKIEISDESEKEVDEFLELVHNTRSEKQSSGEESETYKSLREKLYNWSGELNNIANIVR